MTSSTSLRNGLEGPLPNTLLKLTHDRLLTGCWWISEVYHDEAEEIAGRRILNDLFYACLFLSIAGTTAKIDNWVVPCNVRLMTSLSTITAVEEWSEWTQVNWKCWQCISGMKYFISVQQSKGWFYIYEINILRCADRVPLVLVSLRENYWYKYKWTRTELKFNFPHRQSWPQQYAPTTTSEHLSLEENLSTQFHLHVHSFDTCLSLSRED